MRKSCIIYVLLALFCIAVPVTASAIEGYPGSSWGQLYWDIPTKEGKQNVVLEGWIEQGVTWVKWDKPHGDILLNTYGTIRYKWDDQKYDWNNKFAPGVGVGLDIYIDQFHMRVGAEYLWERFYESGTEQQKVWIYTDWYGWWDLKK